MMGCKIEIRRHKIEAINFIIWTIFIRGQNSRAKFTQNSCKTVIFSTIIVSKSHKIQKWTFQAISRKTLVSHNLVYGKKNLFGFETVNRKLILCGDFESDFGAIENFKFKVDDSSLLAVDIFDPNRLSENE